MLEREGMVRRDDVDVVGLDLLPVASLDHGHGRVAADDLDEHAGLVRSKVGHHDEGETGIRRQRAEQALERLHAAGGSADADDEQVVVLPAHHPMPSGTCSGRSNLTPYFSPT